MSQSVFSQSWHNVAGLRPRLLPHAQFHRHTYRGQRWYVVHDTTSRRYHRITPAAYELVERMNGVKTVQQLWDDACESGTANVPTQNEIVDLLVQLHANDLLFCDVTPDAAKLFERYKKQKRTLFKQRFANPLSIRIPLVDPDALIERWTPRVAWIFGPFGFVLWLAAVVPAIGLVAAHWGELTNNMTDQVLASQNLFLIALLFIPIKILHEFGHGFSTKLYGGAVPEMGVMLLVFAPVPYVDSSSSAAFASKTRRAVVGAAGMFVETFLAAIAMYVWLLVEPGLIRAIAFNVMLIAGVSTLVVNGNPLLRFDGYYILSDLIGMPNLAQRAQRYWKYLSDRYLLRAKGLEMPTETSAERRWLFFYLPLSWVYRTLVTVSIILFVAGEFFIFGVLIALWGVVMLILAPLWKAFKHLTTSPTLRTTRGRALRIAFTVTASIVAILVFLPMPSRTQSEGVVWLPDKAVLRAGANGFFRQWLVEPGTPVKSGIPLSTMYDAELEAEVNAARGRVAEHQARYDAVQFDKPADAAIIERKLAYEKTQLDNLLLTQSRLFVVSESEGSLVVPQAEDMSGRYFKQGELLGYILDRDKLLVRVVVTQDDIDLVRNRLRGVEMRFVDAATETYHARSVHAAPGGVNELPSPALGPNGGGLIAMDPEDNTGATTLQRIFIFDLDLPTEVRPTAIGSRVFVRFDHTPEPLFSQWYRRIRQLFLSRLHV